MRYYSLSTVRGEDQTIAAAGDVSACGTPIFPANLFVEASMRGVLVEEFTEFVNLKLVECPEPDIRPKQVRIRVQATGVSFA